jgi:hypothetical protein
LIDDTKSTTFAAPRRPIRQANFENFVADARQSVTRAVAPLQLRLQQIQFIS